MTGPPVPGRPPTGRRAGWRGWVARVRDWPTLRAVLCGWWYSPAAYELRAAWLDSRRHPGLIALGMVAVFWPLTGFTLLPVAVAAAACVVVWLVTRPLWWLWRWRARRATLPAIGLLTLGVLTLRAGWLAWGLAIGLWLIVAAFTDTWRARRRLLAWITHAVARAIRADPADLRVRQCEWDGRRLTWAEVDTAGRVRIEDTAVRDRIAGAVSWCLRHAGTHTLTWPPGTNTFEITADLALPAAVDEQLWPGDLPGIPIGVTDAADADGTVDTVDAETGQVVASLPVKLIHPGDSQRHYLVVGGTGAGKSNFVRGLVARSMRDGWFPGGCYIFDGKAASDYIVFEGRAGIHCVAREPEEWEQHMADVSTVMRARYDEDAAYHRGQRTKPDHPRWLIVMDEIQEIRRVLGKKAADAFLQQISRQVRGANGRLVLVTQRPDTEDAIPGAVRDMLEDRIILGYVSGTGARMVLGQDWQTVTDEYGHTPVPGRGMARIAGRLVRLQSFRLDPPREHPELEPFYPAKASPPAHPISGASTGTEPATARWAPHPTPPVGEAGATDKDAATRQPDDAASPPRRDTV